MITPVPMPMYLPHGSNDSERCPHCHRKEDKKEVCRHCGYEYEEEEASLSWWEILVGLFVIFLIAAIIFSAIGILVEWLGGFAGDHSLWEIIKDHWHDLTSKRIW